jgi:hypothetical protein
MMLKLRVYFIRYILLLLDSRFCSVAMFLFPTSFQTDTLLFMLYVCGLNSNSNIYLSFLKVFLGGYNDKMRVLLHTIMTQIVNFEVKPNRFSALKVRWDPRISLSVIIISHGHVCIYLVLLSSTLCVSV